MKRPILLIILFIFCGCKTNHDLTGDYAGIKPGKLKITIGQLLGIKYFSGYEITLSKDSTFVFETCAMRMRGNWTVKGDTLLMYYSDRKFKVEEFNTDPEYANAIRISTVPDKMFIDGNCLIRKGMLANGDTTISKLRKITE